MFNALIKVLFFLITRIFNLIMIPIVAFINALIPNTSQLFTHITAYLTLALTYVRSIMNLLLIPDEAVIILFDYFTICITIYYGILAYRFVVKIYNTFKL